MTAFRSITASAESVPAAWWAAITPTSRFCSAGMFFCWRTDCQTANRFFPGRNIPKLGCDAGWLWSAPVFAGGTAYRRSRFPRGSAPCGTSGENLRRAVHDLADHVHVRVRGLHYVAVGRSGRSGRSGSLRTPSRRRGNSSSSSKSPKSESSTSSSVKSSSSSSSMSSSSRSRATCADRRAFISANWLGEILHGPDPDLDHGDRGDHGDGRASPSSDRSVSSISSSSSSVSSGSGSRAAGEGGSSCTRRCAFTLPAETLTKSSWSSSNMISLKSSSKSAAPSAESETSSPDAAVSLTSRRPRPRPRPPRRRPRRRFGASSSSSSRDSATAAGAMISSSSSSSGTGGREEDLAAPDF